jgi:hypothetical protein
VFQTPGATNTLGAGSKPPFESAVECGAINTRISDRLETCGNSFLLSSPAAAMCYKGPIPHAGSKPALTIFFFAKSGKMQEADHIAGAVSATVL